MEQVRSYATYRLDFSPRKPSKGPSVTSLASSDPILAKHTDIRDITKGILTELDKHDALAIDVFKKIAALRSKPQISTSGPASPRKKPPNTPFEEEIKLQEPLLEKKVALKKDIERRLDLMKAKIGSPATQAFFMPFDSPLYQAMIQDNPFARRFPGQ